MNDWDRAVLKGAALVDAYKELTGTEDVEVEQMIVDLLAWRQGEPDQLASAVSSLAPVDNAQE